MSRWEPLYLKDMSAWIRNPSIGMYGRWNHPPPPGCPNCPGEGGVDLTSPQGTPIYALETGPIMGAGNVMKAGGANVYGVITQRINVPGYGVNDIYYQHIFIDKSVNICPNGCGQTAIKGQKIGVTGPYNEIELGFNANWGPPWGKNHPGPWITDPRPMLKALMDAGPPGTINTNPPPTVGTPTVGTPGPGAAGLLTVTDISVPGPSTYVPMLDQVHETLINHPGFYGIALTLDEAEQFPGYIDLTQPVKVDTAVGTFDLPDVTGTARSVGATVTDNFLPFAIRSGLVVLGMALDFALIVKPVMQVAGPVAEVLA